MSYLLEVEFCFMFLYAHFPCLMEGEKKKLLTDVCKNA